MVMVRNCLDGEIGNAPQSQQVRANLRVRRSKQFFLSLELLGTAFVGCPLRSSA